MVLLVMTNMNLSKILPYGHVLFMIAHLCYFVFSSFHGGFNDNLRLFKFASFRYFGQKKKYRRLFALVPKKTKKANFCHFVFYLSKPQSFETLPRTTRNAGERLKICARYEIPN